LMLIFTTIIMKSAGALSYFFFGLAVLYLSSKIKNSFLVIVLLLCPHLYMIARAGGSWDGRNLSDFIAEKFSRDRADSLQFRFDNESILLKKALDGSFFGWGGWSRSRVMDNNGKDIAVTDGKWIIVYGLNGVYGLSVFVMMIQLPVILFIFRLKPEVWKSVTFATPAAMAIFISLTMIDNLLNAMENPIYMVIGGGLIGMFIKNPEFYSPEEENIISEMIEKIITRGTRFIGTPESQLSEFIN